MQNPAEVQNLGFYDLKDDDLSLLRMLKEKVAPQIDQIIEQFYKKLFEDKIAQEFLTNSDVVKSLKKTQKSYLLETLSGNVNAEYVKRRIEIGLAHVRVNLPLTIYIGAYRILFHLLSEVIEKDYADDDRRFQTFSALNKIFYFEQSLAIEAYVQKTKSILTIKNEKLAEMNNQINRFVGMVVHDLRTPLNGIFGYSHLILMNENLQEDTKSDVVEIKNCTESMMNIINDLLDISALESGKIRVQKSSTDLRQVIINSLKSVNPFAKKKKINIEITSKQEEYPVEVDIGKLQQVIVNLLTNAIKYSPVSEKVVISIESLDKSVQIGIHDKGIGIPTSEHKKVFTPFGKTSARPTAGESSTGLGLFIVKKIVEAHDGIVWFQSEEGRGSDFYLKLPTAVNGGYK